MSSLDLKALRSRVEAIKAGLWTKGLGGTTTVGDVHAGVQSTISVLALIYGDSSPQLAHFHSRLKVKGSLDEGHTYNLRLANEIGPALDAALADFESGLTTSVRVQAKGEVLGDFVALARAALSANSDATDRVAAVLAAGALEETLKQLGEVNGVDVHGRDMRGVIQKLKDANVLIGAQSGVATGLVKFRDHAFHGEFDQIQRPSTEAAVAFVESLLLSRMS